MSPPDEATVRLAERAARALLRPGARIEPAGAAYVLRAGVRRPRPVMRLDETAFRLLVEGPGLRPRAEGGWTLRRRLQADAPAARPGAVEGERTVVEKDGGLVSRRANLGESPLYWLAHRRGADGAPLLSPVEVAAGERLREDYYRAGLIGRLTMDWASGPRGGGGRGAGLDPALRGLKAKARVQAALAAAGAECAPMLTRICLMGSALEAAERDLGIARRAGKRVLKQGLSRLAAFYGLA